MWVTCSTRRTGQNVGPRACVALSLALSVLVFGCDGTGRSVEEPRLSPLPVGQTLQRTLPGDPPLDYIVRVSPEAGEGALLFVSVHGISRNAATHARLFARLVDSYGVVLLAPLFEPPHFADYQRLGRTRLGSRADRVLEEAVAEVGRLTGARTDRVFLFGYSGGAQFVHRFVMAHPGRVAAAAVSSAGWYTFPNPRLPYPLGIGSTTGLQGIGFDLEAFLRVPMLVTVGERDTQRDASLRQNDAVDHQQGQTRAERARRWVAAMQDAARGREIPAAIELRELPGVDHSFSESMERAELGEIVFEHLFDRRVGVQNRSPGRGPMARPASG